MQKIVAHRDNSRSRPATTWENAERSVYRSRPVVSVICPSLRPHLIADRIEDFARTHPHFHYQLVVVSPFDVDGPNVLHIRETEPAGCVAAHLKAFPAACGDYIVWWADDAIPTFNCLARMVHFVARQRQPFIGSFRMRGKLHLEMEQWSCWDRQYACYGCASRETLQQLGGYFDPVYHSHWPDVDLAMRCWHAGGRVASCPDAWLLSRNAEDEIKSNSLPRIQTDGETFKDHWDDIFGDGTRPFWADFNREIPLPMMSWNRAHRVGRDGIAKSRIFLGYIKRKLLRQPIP